MLMNMKTCWQWQTKLLCSACIQYQYYSMLNGIRGFEEKTS